MPFPSSRISGVLNAQEILVAEAIQARALGALAARRELSPTDLESAKAQLGGIVVRLMSDRTKSIGDLSAAAIEAFEARSGTS